jgi:serine/threonine-protein kinase
MLDVLDSIRESLAPRYDIEREIGVGGMARVYLAVEQHPHRRVAIKVLDPELSTRLLRERFIREVDLSSKLSHPHIVPIFAAGEAAGLFYYVMPYIEGESLRHRLRRERRLPVEDALHIARDVADALAFAHGQGIVHRDIKPENILLAGDHSIVADFGIARAISAAGNLTLTQTGQSIGSPGYMSPEQALGLATDPRSDIYSLGCVLFEMLAGEQPVPSVSDRQVHNWSALDTSPELRRSGTGTARAVKHAISRALAPMPDDRFATAAEFSASIGGAARRVPVRGWFSGRRGRRVALAGGLLAIAAVGVTAALLLGHSDFVLNERRVVVAIANRSGDPSLDNIGHMAADWVTQGLAQTALVEVVPSISVMMSSMAEGGAGQAGGRLDATGIRRLGRETGAGTVVAGGYYRAGDSIRFQIHIADSKDATVLRALEPIAAPVARPLEGVEVVRQRVMAALATMFDSRLMEWAMTASQPPNYQAYQEFIAGLDRFVQFDPPGAVHHFVRAATVDSTFRLPLIFAANAYMNINNFAAAESLGRSVLPYAGQLAPLDRAYLNWVLAICRGDAVEAFRASRAMVSLAPGSEAQYLVANDAMALNRPADAVEALTALGPDRGFTRGWWIYWDNLAWAYHMLGDHRRELKAALEGVRRFPGNLQLLTSEARALAALGRSERLGEVLDASEGLPSELGWTLADEMLLIAGELRAHGHPGMADSVLSRAHGWLSARGPEESRTEAHRYRVALTAYSMGRLDEAQRETEALVAGPLGDRRGAIGLVEPADTLDYLGLLGVIAAKRGDRDRALALERRLASIQRRYLFGRHTMARARIRALLGDREGAVELVRESLRQGYPHGHTLHTDDAFERLRDYEPFRDVLKPKD